MSGRAYKFLRRGAIGPFSQLRWPLPTAQGPGAWLETEGALVECSNGLHLLRVPDLAHWLLDELWLVEHDGDLVEGTDCLVVRRARLLRPIDAWHSGGGADRFALAARDHLVELAAGADPSLRELLDGIIRDASAHLPRRSTALAAFCAAVGISKLHADPRHGYRLERQWQSDWIARHLSLAAHT
jgi:hypothetical protein